MSPENELGKEVPLETEVGVDIPKSSVNTEEGQVKSDNWYTESSVNMARSDKGVTKPASLSSGVDFSKSSVNQQKNTSKSSVNRAPVLNNVFCKSLSLVTPVTPVTPVTTTFSRVTNVTSDKTFLNAFSGILLNRTIGVLALCSIPLSYNELAESLGESRNSINVTISRNEQFFQIAAREGTSNKYILSPAGRQYADELLAQAEFKQVYNSTKSLENRKLQTQQQLEFTASQLWNDLPKHRDEQAVYISFQDLAMADPAFAESLLEEPDLVLSALTEAATDSSLSIRITELPTSAHVSIENLRQEHLNHLVVLEGRAVSLSSVRPIITQASFECRNCGATMTIFPKDNVVQPPKRCSCGFRGPFTSLYQQMTNGCNLMLEDLQERTDNPHLQRLKCLVANDLVRPSSIQIFTPGNEVKAIGIPRGRIKEVKNGISASVDLVFEVLHAEPFEQEISLEGFSDEDVQAFRELAARIDQEGLHPVRDSFAPEVFGYEEVKEAVILQLCSRRNELKIRKARNKPNILMIGDPGVAKSLIGRFAVEVIPGSRKALGGGSSAVGLTASTIKEEDDLGGWRVEPGAMVLAKELIFIDELNNLSDDDKPKLQEGMNEQCYDDQTEILTENGWKLFKDIRNGEKIATLNGDRLEYHVPTNYFEAEYNGDIYYIRSQQVDLAVTPQHKLYTSTCLIKDRKNWNTFNLIEASNLADKTIRMKKNAVWESDDQELFEIPSVVINHNQFRHHVSKPIHVKMDDWLEFLGYYLSEGSLMFQNLVPYNVVITQSSKANPDVCCKIEDCLNRLGFKWNKTTDNYYVCNKQIAHYLSMYGSGASTKRVPRFVKNLSARQITIFIEALIDGDGYRRGNGSSYVTTSKWLADDVQEIALKIGMSANIYKRTREQTESYNPHIGGRKLKPKHPPYTVQIITKHTPTLNHHGLRHFTKRKYSGKIYCVDVHNHVVYVRRNGKPVWSGNSITINKANVHCTLKVSCGILAAANPIHGFFDLNSDIITQFNIPVPIMNRFDIIFVMKDQVNEVKDRNIACRMLDRETGDIKSMFSPEFLRKFFVYVREQPEPEFSAEVKQTASDLYTNIRKGDTRRVVINPRFMESLIRLVKASAKLRLSRIVEQVDIDRCLRILSKSHYNIDFHPLFEQLEARR